MVGMFGICKLHWAHSTNPLILRGGLAVGVYSQNDDDPFAIPILQQTDQVARVNTINEMMW